MMMSFLLVLIVVLSVSILSVVNAEEVSRQPSAVLRRLQFEDVAQQTSSTGGMDEPASSSASGMRQNRGGRRGNSTSKAGKRRGKGGSGGMNANQVRLARGQVLSKAVDNILFEADRYHMWWTGPVNEPNFSFQPEAWSAPHNGSANAIFTMAVIQGHHDNKICSSPNDLILFLGSARRHFHGDIVVALEIDRLTDTMKNILTHYRATVYILPQDLCEKQTTSIFCGMAEERVPASVFRYYFYEKWAANYQEDSLILLSDFRDIIFQANPFTYRLQEWFPEHNLAVFQEFYPNMVINRCRFNTKIISECYGEEALRQFGSKSIVSSGALLGTRDGIVVWTHYMTMQLQEAPGRMVETRCFSGGIDHGFVNWLVYGKKLRQLLRIRLFAHGEGSMNSLGGLRPDTVHANITGSLQDFWKLLTPQGHVLSWNGDLSPVVHQLDHFQEELLQIADNLIAKEPSHFTYGAKSDNMDRLWQVFSSTRCLFDCTDSLDFSKAASVSPYIP